MFLQKCEDYIKLVRHLISMDLCQLESWVHLEKSVHEIRFGTKCPENPGARAAKCNFEFPHGCRIWTLAKFIVTVWY